MVVSMKRWVNKVAIVTGASSGIGAAIAEKLVKEGLIVVGVARRFELVTQHANQLSKEKGKLYAFKGDMTKEEDILRLFDWTTKNVGIVHILINNAGTGARSTLLEGETKDWKKVLDLNVVGLCIATREAFRVMKAHNINGHIIHLNSIFGHSVAHVPNMNIYSATKYAVTALTETLRFELNSVGSKIKISSISPGIVDSELTIRNKQISAEERTMFEKMSTLKAEDIADSVVFILSTPEHVQIHDMIVKAVGEVF